MCIVDFFFFSSRRRHTRSLCDWSSDVCSSDLEEVESEVSMSDTNFDFPSQKHVSAEIVRKDENMERDVFHREIPGKHPDGKYQGNTQKRRTMLLGRNASMDLFNREQEERKEAERRFEMLGDYAKRDYTAH